MHGLMMDTPLLISSIAEHAATFHGEQEIVSVTADNPQFRYTFADAISRSKQLANALESLGLDPSDRIATLAWNDHRHLEIYYAVSGAGFVCHTINPRLFPEQLVFIINHAEDRYIFVDAMFMPLIEAIADKLPTVEAFVVMTDAASMPESSLENLLCYETLISTHADDYEWPELDELSASALCYTSGTTGDPKGVLYNHRSTILHAMCGIAPDAMGLSSTDVVLPVVPLFHVNAWGVPYCALMVGCKLVLPGPKMGDGEALYNLLEGEGVTQALGVPTVWLALLQYCEKEGKTLNTLQRSLVGGAAVPRSMVEAFELKHGVTLRQGWGMTEMSPLGTINSMKSGLEHLDQDQILDLKTKAGRGLYGVELRIVDEQGREQAWDGEAYGALQVRGPWICSDYYRLDGSAGAHTDDGWFDTGDVATIDPHGFMAITDRTKDVIKSGGEWISSIDLENCAMGHPKVAEAAVIGVPHPKWSERPLLVVVTAEGQSLEKAEMLKWFDGKVATWWIPEAVEFVAELPHTATGKIKKTELRKQFADYSIEEG